MIIVTFFIKSKQSVFFCNLASLSMNSWSKIPTFIRRTKASTTVFFVISKEKCCHFIFKEISDQKKTLLCISFLVTLLKIIDVSTALFPQACHKMKLIVQDRVSQ